MSEIANAVHKKVFETMEYKLWRAAESGKEAEVREILKANPTVDVNMVLLRADMFFFFFFLFPFAALQCQVQFGNHEPDRHKPGFLK